MLHDSPTVIDFFCGAGGLSLGFSRAGFKIVAAYDSWAPAITTYNVNHHDKAHKVDIVDDMQIQRPDIVIGAPPCQGFSSAGMRRSRDERNSLVRVFANLVAGAKPRAFVFENVEGFLTSDHGRYVFDLLEPLVSVGYRIHLRKVNAANFGVPQHRKRVIAIGGLNWNPTFPEPTHSAYGAPGAHLVSGNLPPTPTLQEALASLPRPTLNEAAELDHHVVCPLNDDDLARARLLRQGQRMRDLPEEFWHESYRRRAFRRVQDGTPTEKRGGAPAGLLRLRENEPSKAITGGALNEFLHPTEDRPLTVRECARLQTLPDAFVFPVSRRDTMQLIGNAVPPQFAETIARCLKQCLASANVETPKGQLLSFVPTLSNGTSPVLRDVINKVEESFEPANGSQQLRLQWP